MQTNVNQTTKQTDSFKNPVVARQLLYHLDETTAKKTAAHMKVLTLASLPVLVLIEAVHMLIPHNRKVGQCIAGIVLMATGSALSASHPEWANHVIWDAFSWGIHGVGLAPVATVVLRHFGIDG